MELERNKLKGDLLAKNTCYGVWNALVNSYAGEICALSGFDWLVIDMEHGPFTLDSVLVQIQALSRYNISVAVRPPDHSAAEIKRLLDLGVQSLVIPMVENAEQASALVRAVRYPPTGIRGVAPMMSRAAQWGAANDYINQADGEIALILQVESEAGIKNIDSIACTEGVDCVFIGPSDLSTSMGFKGDFENPKVQRVISEALGKIRSCGKSAGILSLTPELTKKYTGQGANMIGTAVDILLLKNALQEAFKRNKA